MAIEASAGARVGDYVLVRKIGEGGMAEVWLARHGVSAQLRALKFLNSQFQGIPEVEARFQNEGENTLIHPNIVRIFEVGQQGGSSFIAMEYVDGHDLENILNSRRGPLTIAESIDIGTQILAGLGFAHSNGIIHRDIKPSNVLVDQEGRAYVMDFGIAKVARAGRVLTQVNSRLGTPDYMSPEQIKNPRDVDTRSDIYSFGCLFCELLTGWPPFDRGEGYETEHDIKTAHVTLPPTPPSVRKPGLPEQLNAITLKCLAKAKEDRPQTCDEVIAAFNAYRISTMKKQPSRSNTVVEPPPPPMPKPVPGPVPGTTPPFAGRPTPNPMPPPVQGSGFSGSGFSGSGLPGHGLPGHGPNPVPRRATEVIPSIAPPFNTGSGVHGRTPTIVEPPGNAQAVNQGSGTPPVLPPVAPPGIASSFSPFPAPDNAGHGDGTPAKSDGFPWMFVIAAVSLFAIIALSASAWAWYQKSRADDLGSGTANSSNNGTEQTAANTSQETPQTPVQRPSQQDGQPTSPSQPGTGQSGTDQSGTGQSGTGQSGTGQSGTGQSGTGQSGTIGSPASGQSGQPVILTQKARDRIIQQEMGKGTPPSPQPGGEKKQVYKYDLPSFDGNKTASPQGPSMSTLKVPSATSGTLVWTGDSNTLARHSITIVRSNGTVLGGGQISGAMFPALPVDITIYPNNGTVVFPPSATTNFNTLQLFLTTSGAQTIYIRWKVKPS